MSVNTKERKTELQAKVYAILAMAGIQPGTGSLYDYERGKQLLQQRRWESGEYYRAIKHLADWVGV